MANKHLAIAIPTYNRDVILKENLLIMLPEIIKYQIPVYISDDSDNDLTSNMISDFKGIYNNIRYYKNIPSLGHDKNCLRTLGMPNEEYIWYLGDSQIIKENGIECVLGVIEREKKDFILVNSDNRNVTVGSQVYTNANDFFVDLTWHATLTGATIYRKEVLFRKEYQKYVGSNFMQLAIILEEMLAAENGLLWINEKIIYGNQNKKESYWTNNTFKVFAQDWVNFINLLPGEYLDTNKRRVMKSHSDHTNIFKLGNYILLRKKGILNLKAFFKYYQKLKYASSLNIFFVLVIALLPKKMLNRIFQ